MANRTTDTKTNIALLMSEMKEEIYHQCLFSPWTGNASVKYEWTDDKPTKSIVMSSQMVNKIEDWSSYVSGRPFADSIEFPQRKRLTGDGFAGDSWIEKTGEDLEYRWTKCFINLYSKTVMEKRGDMDQLRDEDIYDLLNGAHEEIVVWWKQRLNAHFTAAIYEGASTNVTMPIPQSPNGIGLVKALPANVLYYNSSTTDITSVDTVGYNCLPATLHTLLTTPTNVAGIGVVALIKLRAYLRKNLFLPCIPYKGRMLYGMIVSDDEITTLLQVDAFTKNYEKVDYAGQTTNGMMLTPEAYVYQDIMFIVDSYVARKYYNVALGFAGPKGIDGGDGYLEFPTTTYADHNFNIILGKQALIYAVDKRFNMKTNHETFNHKAIQEMSMKHVYGMQRMDYVDEADMATYYAKSKTVDTYLTARTAVYNKSIALMLWSN